MNEDKLALEVWDELGTSGRYPEYDSAFALEFARRIRQEGKGELVAYRLPNGKLLPANKVVIFEPEVDYQGNKPIRFNPWEPLYTYNLDDPFSDALIALKCKKIAAGQASNGNACGEVTCEITSESAPAAPQSQFIRGLDMAQDMSKTPRTDDLRRELEALPKYGQYGYNAEAFAALIFKRYTQLERELSERDAQIAALREDLRKMTVVANARASNEARLEGIIAAIDAARGKK